LDFTPQFFLHSSDGEWLRYADFIAPCFVFALAIGYSIGLQKYRESGDYRAAFKRYFGRFLALIGVGFLLFAIPQITDGAAHIGFNVFSAYGVAGLYSLFFLKTNKKVRLVSGGILVILYQLLLLIPWCLEYVLANDFGGLLGAMPWCGFLLISVTFAEYYRENFKNFTRLAIIACCVATVFGALGIISIYVDGFAGGFFIASKLRVSMGYLAVSLEIAVGVFWIFAKFTSSRELPLFTEYGRNSFIMYLLGGGIGNGTAALANLFVSKGSVGLVLVGGLLVCTTITGDIAYFLNRKNVYVTI
jgi:hypothetical protein